MSEYDKLTDAEKVEVWREAVRIGEVENQELRAKLLLTEYVRDEHVEAVLLLAKAVHESAWQVTDEGEDVFTNVSPAVMANPTAATAVRLAANTTSGGV